MKRLLVGGAGVAAGLGLAGAGAAAYVAKMVQGRATGDIDGFLDRKDPNPHDVVVCLGASIVRGRASVDFVDMLRARLPQLEFVNGGINNDTADDVLQRLDPVIACRPRAIVILVGTSDAQAILNPDGAATKKKQKETGQTQPPTVEEYRRTLQAAVTELADRTGARIGLCSLPPLGQKIDSSANDVVRSLNAAVLAVAEATGETYLPVYEQMVSYLESADATDGKDFTGDWRVGARSLSQHFIVGRSYDAIAEHEGLLLSPDYVHLNTAGASIVADVAQEFLTPLVTEQLTADAATTVATAVTVPEVRETTEQTPESEPETEAEPLPEAKSEPVSEPEPEPEPALAAEPEPEPEPEPVSEPELEPEPTQAAEPESEPEPESNGPITPAPPEDDQTQTDPVPAPRPSEPSPFEPASSIEPEGAPAPRTGPSPYGG